MGMCMNFKMLPVALVIVLLAFVSATVSPDADTSFKSSDTALIDSVETAPIDKNYVADPVDAFPIREDYTYDSVETAPIREDYTYDSVETAPIDSGYSSSPVDPAPIDRDYKSDSTKIVPVDKKEDNNNGGGNSGGSGGRSRNNNDDDEGGRRRDNDAGNNNLDFEELSADLPQEDDNGRFSGITGAVIGVLGEKGALGIGVLFVVLGVVGLFVYNREKFGVVKAEAKE